MSSILFSVFLFFKFFGKLTPGFDVAPILFVPARTASLTTPIISSLAPLIALPDFIFSYVVKAESPAPSILPLLNRLAVFVIPPSTPNIESPPVLLGDGVLS